jgi:hypothetical protein
MAAGRLKLTIYDRSYLDAHGLFTVPLPDRDGSCTVDRAAPSGLKGLWR